jgi:hypothetical protein
MNSIPEVVVWIEELVVSRGASVGCDVGAKLVTATAAAVEVERTLENTVNWSNNIVAMSVEQIIYVRIKYVQRGRKLGLSEYVIAV